MPALRTTFYRTSFDFLFFHVLGPFSFLLGDSYLRFVPLNLFRFLPFIPLPPHLSKDFSFNYLLFLHFLFPCDYHLYPLFPLTLLYNLLLSLLCVEGFVNQFRFQPLLRFPQSRFLFFLCPTSFHKIRPSTLLVWHPFFGSYFLPFPPLFTLWVFLQHYLLLLQRVMIISVNPYKTL
jgi:hypothetical protein